MPESSSTSTAFDVAFRRATDVVYRGLSGTAVNCPRREWGRADPDAASQAHNAAVVTSGSLQLVLAAFPGQISHSWIVSLRSLP